MATRLACLWVVIAGLTVGCGGVRGPCLTSPQRIGDRLDHADALARVGEYADARERYAAVLAESGGPPGADRALLGLARLTLDPRNPERDERQAGEYLDRLVVTYPHSGWAVEAGTWRSLLRSVERLRGDLRRQQRDHERLRLDLQREQQETARLRDERERLRQIDVEFERPRGSQSSPTSAQFPLRPRE